MQKHRVSKGLERCPRTCGSRKGKGRLEAEQIVSRHSHMGKQANFQTYCKHCRCNHPPPTFPTPTLVDFCVTQHPPTVRAVCLCHLWDTKNLFFCFGMRPCPDCDTAGPHLVSLSFLHPAPGVPLTAWPQVAPCSSPALLDLHKPWIYRAVRALPPHLIA